MKLNTRSVVVGVLALASIIAATVVIWPANIPSASAQARAPRRPGCQMWSNPITATGGSVRLTYTVGDLPTTITIEADDSSATPPGTPTVGAPDPNRADSQQEGSIDSGPVTKRTVFTMTVSNSMGTSDCSVTVPFAARPAEGLRLPLIATLLDIPPTIVNMGPTFGNQSISSAAYSNGTFAFSGQCGGSKNSTYLGSFLRQGGAWFFRDDGTEIAERDICMDGGSASQSMYFHGSANSQIIADGDRGFFMAVRSFAASSGGSGADRAGYYQVAGDSVLFSPSSNFTVVEMGFAAANGKVIGDVGLELPGNSDRNVTLSLPSLQILAEREVNSIIPQIGFGDYILGRRDGASTDRCSLSQYSGPGMPTVFRIEPDGGLTSVQTLTLPDGLCPGGMAIDYTTSPKRLAVTSFTISGSRASIFSNRIFLFTSGANGLEPAGELTVPASVLSDAIVIGHAGAVFAIGGSYLAFAGALPIVRGGGPADGIFFSLWRDNELVGIAEPPARRLYNPGEFGGDVASNPVWLYITPQGKIMGANGSTAYLFGGTPGPSTSTPPIPPNPSTSTPTQIPGQILSVVYSTTSTPPTPPKILIRMANILSVSPTSLNISIFGHTYTVDASQAKTYNMNWALIPFSSFTPGSYVNVWGTLDLQDSTLIHGINIRNPLPPGTQTGTSTVAPFTAPAQTPASAAATQLKLNTLQEALRALQLRLAQ